MNTFLVVNDGRHCFHRRNPADLVIVFKFRDRPGALCSHKHILGHKTGLEIGWTVVPNDQIVLFILIPTVKGHFCDNSRRRPKDAAGRGSQRTTVGWEYPLS
jgi:heme/copper-type cytochrome/quinol oxidase subunit 2